MSPHDSESSQELSTPKNEPSPKSTDHGAMIFVALLENFVKMNPATAHLGDEGKKIAYNSIIDDLTKGGVLPKMVTELTTKNHAARRVEYHEALDNLLKRKVQAVNRGGIVVEDEEGLIIDRDNVRVLPSLFETNIFSATPIPHLVPGTIIPLNSGAATRYNKDYQQLEFLGKGGFGIVWSCRHVLDGQLYAVKQVYLNKVLEPILQGKSKGDWKKIYGKVFTEIRTLASLDHCNVVRYFNSWLEAMPLVEFKKQNEPESGSFELDSYEYETESEATATQVSEQEYYLAEIFNRLETIGDASVEVEEDWKDEDEDSGDEDEGEEKSVKKSSLNTSTAPIGNSTQDNSNQALTRRAPTNDSSASDQTVVLPPNRFAYIMYMQMSLHPLTLEQYINGAPWPSGSGNMGQIRHTFQPISSIKLLLKIMDGVEYLHRRKLVHRDLKPANIFLTIEDEENGSFGGVQMGRGHCPGLKCALCGASEDVQEVCLKDVNRWVVPKIGDFGLVKDLNPSDGMESADERAPGDEVVGTVFYRPPTPTSPLVRQRQLNTSHDKSGRNNRRYRACEKVDVYALGVILFELLYRMNSASERVEVLTKFTKRPQYPIDSFLPADFPTHRYGRMHTDIIAVVTKMTTFYPYDRCTLFEAREMLQEIVEA